jgi:hypothetical protein
MSFAAGSVHLEDTSNQALNAIKIELRNIVREGIDTATGSETWFAYWTAGRIRAFTRYMKALVSLIEATYGTDHERDEALERGNRACRETIAQTHPSIAASIDESDAQVLRACQIVENFQPLQDLKRRTLDNECARGLDAYLCWYGIAMNSLVCACQEHPTEDGLIEFLHTLVSNASSSALASAQAAAAIRSVPPDEQVVLNARIEAASDGFGFVGAIQELDLETCAETHAETHELLRQLVTGYLAAERSRGDLAGALADLGVTGAPSRILVSMYVQDGGAALLPDVIDLPL